jgi:copper transport protein
VRRLLIVVVACTAVLAAAATASAHAVLESSTPAADSRVAAAPASVVLRFSEPVQVGPARGSDVVFEDGSTASAAPGTIGRDGSSLVIPLRPALDEGTYTVRYAVIGGDSHVIPGVVVFGVGDGPLGDAVLGGGEGGPSETGVWGTSARFLEIVGLGGLIGLIAFRWLVWAPAARAGLRGRPAEERTTVLTWGRDAFWVAFGALAVGAMIAEGYLLVVHSATVLGTGVWAALGDPAGISQVLGDTRFGGLVQLRGALLFVVFVLGCVLFLREYGSGGEAREAEPAGPAWSALAMGALLLAVLGGVAAQGHARVTDLPALQIGAHLLHVAAVAVWLTGLALLAVVHLRLPRVDPVAGPVVAARVLSRFSRIAFAAVGVAILTGVVRTIGEISDPAELWETAYGRSILIKLALLVPIALIALQSRRVEAAVRLISRPNTPTLRLVRRSATAELALSMVVVLVATVLVAQVPGAA